MTQEMGETRDAMALNCMNQAQEYAAKLPVSERPCFLAFYAKADRHAGAIRQHFSFYKNYAPLLGLLWWYIDEKGEAHFRPELSTPHDVPLDPSILSDKSEDQSARVMEKGKAVKILVS